MVKRKFSCDNGHVEYKRGQPMGLLSSWAVFAYTHHMFIEFCAFQEGYHSFKDYSVLGDDVVIWNRSVASRYKDNLKILDIP